MRSELPATSRYTSDATGRKITNVKNMFDAVERSA